MTRFPSVLGSVFFLAVSSAGAVPQSTPAKGPLRVHPTNPRYFTDGTGRAVYLTGSHLWQNLRDIGPSDPPTVFDYTGYLNLLEANGHNFIRLWAWDLSRSKINLGMPPFQGDQYVVHFPWPRTGPGNARDGKPRFDLGTFDQSYFDRLRSRVIAAGNRGIYVGIMLFEGWGLHSAGAPWRWDGHPMHASNNINGINGNPDGNGYGTEIQMLQIPAVTAIQKAYVRKVVDTVNDLDNVLYEIANESGGYSTAWQYEMINTIKSHQAGKPKQHPVGMTFAYSSLGSGNNSDLFNSPADWISPNRSGGYRDNPPAANGSKVIVADTDHIDPWLTDRQWIWRTFLRGHNPIVMDHYDGSKWNAIRRTMGEARAYADRMDLAAATPRNSLSSTAYCLADPGSEYLVYQPGTGSFTVNLQAASYSYEWFNTVSGKIEGSGTLTASGGSRSLTPPFSNPAVLYLASTTPPPPPPPIPGGLVGHWTLDEGAGATAGDSSGNANDGTLVNGAAWTQGISGGAVRFDGTNDHLSVPDSATLNATVDELTLAAWVYRDADQSGWRVIATRQLGSSTDDQYFLGFRDNEVRFGVHTTTSYPIAAGGAVSNGQWIHLAGTFDGVNVRLYVDGAQVDSIPAGGTILGDFTPLLIGAGRNGGGSSVEEAFAGRLDEVRLYNRALSAAEIAQLAQTAPPPPPPGNGTGLTGLYYATADLSGSPALIRTDGTVDFDWGTGSPDAAVPADGFSARWSGRVTPQYTETYTFCVRTDDGVRLRVDGQLLIDAWVNQSPTEWCQSIALTAGRPVTLEMEYYEATGGAVAELRWSSASVPKEIIPQSQLSILDTDGDGAPDAEETALGTDPNDPASVPGGGSSGGAPGNGGSGGCGATGLEVLVILLFRRRPRRALLSVP